MVCGDCLAILPAVGRADHVVTDPPYDERTHASAVSGKVTEGAGLTFAYLPDPSALAVVLLRSAARWCLAFGSVESMGAYRDGAGKAWVRSGIWDKINPTPQLTGDRPGQAVEAIAIMHRIGVKKRWNKRGEAGIWRYMPPRGDDRPEHETPKPVDLMLALIADFTDPDDIILDPFCGSGTTGVAAIRLGRRFIGIEREPKWAELSRERIGAEIAGSTLQAARAGQEPLFR